MLNSKVMFGLIPPGVNTTVNNLHKLGDALVLFNSATEAEKWLDLQIADNKQYFKIVEVLIALNEQKNILKVSENTGITVNET